MDKMQQLKDDLMSLLKTIPTNYQLDNKRFEVYLNEMLTEYNNLLNVKEAMTEQAAAGRRLMKENEQLNDRLKKMEIKTKKFEKGIV